MLSRILTLASGEKIEPPAKQSRGGSRSRKPGAGLLPASFDDIISRIERGIMLISYFTLILVVSVETLRRMFTGAQVGWGPDVSMYAFVWLAWFALSANIRAGNQLAFTTFRTMLPRPAVRVLEVIDCLLWMALGIIVIVSSTQVVMTDLRLDRVIFSTNIPLAAASLAVPIGWTFSMIRICQALVRILKGKQSRREVDDSTAEAG